MLYIITFLILLLTEIFYFQVANHFKIIDKPNIRSSHNMIVLRGGGIIFPIGMILYFSFFGIVYPWFLIGLLIVCTVSFWDDIKNLPESLRLIMQILAITILLHELKLLNLQYLWIIPLLLVIFVGILNVYNFMDGINGLTGSYSVSVLVPLIILNRSMNFIDMNYLIFIILALLVFLFFNFRTRAICFAGDVGSIGIAFIIIFALGKLILKTHDITYIVLLLVYGIDSLLTICHRIILKENLKKAHRKHLYQLMANELSIPHITISILYSIVQFMISLGIIYLPINHLLYLTLVVLILIVFYLLFMQKYYHLHNNYLKSIIK
jgi:UDP-N-acetylmuramyl pentapeptide phosphotransferase/UDP-N-acetylglucosamine-1-phosphate transferase